MSSCSVSTRARNCSSFTSRLTVSRDRPSPRATSPRVACGCSRNQARMRSCVLLRVSGAVIFCDIGFSAPPAYASAASVATFQRLVHRRTTVFPPYLPSPAPARRATTALVVDLRRPAYQRLRKFRGDLRPQAVARPLLRSRGLNHARGAPPTPSAVTVITIRLDHDEATRRPKVRPFVFTHSGVTSKSEALAPPQFPILTASRVAEASSHHNASMYRRVTMSRRHPR
jgi:hypothetical protein